MTKVVAVLAIHRRPKITLLTLDRLKRQTVPIEIVVSGDSDMECRIAHEAGVHYVEHPNLPLSNKYQAAVSFAKQLKPDAIMTTGSDSWLSDEWCRVGLEEMSENGWDAVGKNSFACMNLETREIVERAYLPPRTSVPDGNGRMVTAEGMGKLGWVLYPPDFAPVNGIDSASHFRCVENGLRTGIMNSRTDVKVMEIKSSQWSSINGFVAIKNTRTLRHLPEIDHPKVWMDIYFPDGWEELNEVFE